MKTITCPDGPFAIEASILFLDDDGNEARVSYTLPKGVYPTADAIKKAIVESTAAVPPGFRLANRHEFVKAELKLPINVAVPGPVDFPK